MSKNIKAVGLISGGLDSMLAAECLIRQGIEVHGIFINTGFCMTEHKRKMLPLDKPKETVRHDASHTSQQLHFPLEIINIADKYWDIVLYPKYGYGKNVNPCIDCRIEMLQVAKKVMEDIGADFVFTGEVLGQRPMTQHRQTLELTEKRSGLKGRIVRPLSGQLLPETLPESEGKLIRDKLLAIQGRSRKMQIALAEEWGILDYAQPAGGCCFLIDESYSRKLNDLFKYMGRGNFGREEVIFLNTGRHLRISPNAKLILNRDEAEYHYFQFQLKDKLVFEARDYPGATGIGEGVFSDKDKITAARIVARYGKGKNESQVDVIIKRNDLQLELLSVTPFKIDDPQVKKMIIS